MGLECVDVYWRQTLLGSLHAAEQRTRLRSRGNRRRPPEQVDQQDARGLRN